LSSSRLSDFAGGGMESGTASFRVSPRKGCDAEAMIFMGEAPRQWTNGDAGQLRRGERTCGKAGGAASENLP
jgi:hypothetical protein